MGEDVETFWQIISFQSLRKDWTGKDRNFLRKSLIFAVNLAKCSTVNVENTDDFFRESAWWWHHNIHKRLSSAAVKNWKTSHCRTHRRNILIIYPLHNHQTLPLRLSFIKSFPLKHIDINFTIMGTILQINFISYWFANATTFHFHSVTPQPSFPHLTRWWKCLRNQCQGCCCQCWLPPPRDRRLPHHWRQ